MLNLFIWFTEKNNKYFGSYATFSEGHHFTNIFKKNYFSQLVSKFMKFFFQKQNQLKFIF